MKTTMFTIALAVATMVPVFGAQAQTPAAPAKPAVQAPATTEKPATAATTKKHHKKAVKKNATKPAASTGSAVPVAKPASK